MCEPRYWKSIRAYVAGNMLRVNLLRSDNILFGQAMVPSVMQPEEIAAKLNELEGYRSCKCDLNNKCKKHKEQK